MPICNATYGCYASGYYLNDDGTSSSLVNNTNEVKLEFIKNEVMWFVFNSTRNATAYSDNIINEADYTGTMYVYNAKAVGLNAHVNFEGMFNNGTIFDMPAGGNYNNVTDRLEVTYRVHMSLVKRFIVTL